MQSETSCFRCFGQYASFLLSLCDGIDISMCLDVVNDYCLFWTYRSVSKVHDEWFADEEKVRRSVGLLEKPVVPFRDGREVSGVTIN